MKYTLIITNLPAFYKINLYNEVAKQKQLFVIFTGDSADQRNSDFFSVHPNFHFEILHGNIWRKIIRIYNILFSNTFDEVIVGGWDSILLWITAFASSMSKNAVVIESSYIESTSKGIKGLLKKIYLNRFRRAYCSGSAQAQLATNLNFKGEIVITKGVGLCNNILQPAFSEKNNITNFLYVGRFSSEKNPELLILTFNQLPHLTLNMIGYGPQEKMLRDIAHSNIIFHGAVDNKILHQYYQANDVLILPSKSEVWGLVVEEAFMNGLPVVVSNKVGCTAEIIQENINGIIFSIEENESLKNAIEKICNINYYNELRKNVLATDYRLNAKNQIDCYLN